MPIIIVLLPAKQGIIPLKVRGILFLSNTKNRVLFTVNYCWGKLSFYGFFMVANGLAKKRFYGF